MTVRLRLYTCNLIRSSHRHLCHKASPLRRLKHPRPLLVRTRVCNSLGRTICDAAKSPRCARAPWYSTARSRSTTSNCDHASTGCESPIPDAVATPPVLMAFDLLHQDGRKLTGRRQQWPSRLAQSDEPIIFGGYPSSVRRIESWETPARLGQRRTCLLDLEGVRPRRYAIQVEFHLVASSSGVKSG